MNNTFTNTADRATLLVVLIEPELTARACQQCTRIGCRQGEQQPNKNEEMHPISAYLTSTLPFQQCRPTWIYYWQGLNTLCFPFYFILYFCVYIHVCSLLHLVVCGTTRHNIYPAYVLDSLCKMTMFEYGFSDIRKSSYSYTAGNKDMENCWQL